MVKKYNEIEAKDNMRVQKHEEEVKQAPTEKKKLEKLVNTQPTKVKRSLISRLVTGVLGPEGLPSIGAYVNEEIVKPAIKNIIVDAVTSGINMVMYGEKNPNRGRSVYPNNHSGYRPNTNYTSRYASSNQRSEREERKIARPSARFDVEEYTITERYDAAHVLTALTEHADMYDSVSVAEYYDLIGVPSKFTDNNYGWTIESISQASIVPIRGGYIIKFPPVEVI